MVDLTGHETGNGGYGQRKPTPPRDSSTRNQALNKLAGKPLYHFIAGYQERLDVLGRPARGVPTASARYGRGSRHEAAMDSTRKSSAPCKKLK